MLYANDLCPTANRPDQLQSMLNCLDGNARRKGLAINTAKSEVVHFNSHGFNVPAFSVGGAPLANKDSFKYLGMVYYWTHNIAKSAEYMLGPFMAGCHRIRQFARENQLNDRPHALLWLATCYTIPASMYACQIWGARFMKQGSEFDSPLQIAHLRTQAVLSQRRAWCEKVHAQLGCVARVWLGAFAVLLVLLCCQVFQLSAIAGIVACSRRLCMQILLLVLPTESVGLRSSLRRVGVYMRQIHMPIALRLQLPLPYKTLWWICVSACMQYGGSWMVQIQGHTLKNWLLIIHRWPCLSNQAMYGALPICCLGTWSWSYVGMCFGTLLVSFACPYPES